MDFETHDRHVIEMQEAEIDRLNAAIRRLQDTMSSQAEQWSRSIAEAEQRGRVKGLEEAAELANGMQWATSNGAIAASHVAIAIRALAEGVGQ